MDLNCLCHYVEDKTKYVGVNTIKNSWIELKKLVMQSVKSSIILQNVLFDVLKNTFTKTMLIILNQFIMLDTLYLIAATNPEPWELLRLCCTLPWSTKKDISVKYIERESIQGK